jgi:uncharacterized protein YggU (UPF0235/DUF167 family)
MQSIFTSVESDRFRAGARSGLGSLTFQPVMTAFLRLKITPNAPANAVLEGTDGVIRLKLQAPAVEGKANAALVAFLAETLRVPKAAVSLKAAGEAG